MSEAERLRDAFNTLDRARIITIMRQFSTDDARHAVGSRGWMWKLPDGSDLFMSDYGLIAAAAPLRGAR